MQIFGIHPKVTMQRSARATLWMPAIAVTGFLAVYLPLAGSLVQVATDQPTEVSANTVAQSQKVAEVQTVQSIAPHPSPTKQVYPNCSPMKFGVPTPLNLDHSGTGLTQQIDQPSMYQIYGATAEELRTQILRCAPGATGISSAEFTAETSYNLTWQYTTLVSAAGCSLSNIKIGLHTAIALPIWQPSNDATSGLQGRWASFMANLQTHEAGHVMLDKQYASNLLSALNTMPTVDCSSLSAAVQSVIDRTVSALNAANDSYDASTNHGATQGAVLPTY